MKNYSNCLTCIACFFLWSLFVMLIWNYLAPTLFKLPEINYCQAMCMKLFVGCFRQWAQTLYFAKKNDQMK